MIDCSSMFYQKMASRRICSVKSQMAPWSFTRALASALYEWTLIFMLFINAIFSYFITTFADYFGLESPCLLCSRLDHILGNKRLRHYWDLVCSKHKSEISSLVYCHAHNKLVDVHGMCETCLFSFATINKSNSETYRLLVGKLGEDSCFDLDNDSSHCSVSSSTRYCTCCNQPWVPRGYSQEAESEELFKIPSVGHSRTKKQAVEARESCKKKVGFCLSPHVGYTQLKIHSDTESEVALSDDDGEVDEDHSFQIVELEPQVITLPDLATEKLIDPVSASEPSNTMNLQEVDFGKRRVSVPELDSPIDAPETSDRVELSTNATKERELISFDDVPLTSNAQELAAEVTKEREFISFETLPSSEARELHADFSRERELTRLHDVSLTSNVREYPVDVSSRLDARKTLTDILMENELIPRNDFPTTSVHQESPANVLKETTKLVSLDEITSTSEAREENNLTISFDEALQSLTTGDIPIEVSKESETAPADDIFPVSASILSSLTPVEPVAEVAPIQCEVKPVETEESYFTENYDDLQVVGDERNTSDIVPEANNLSSVPSEAGTAPGADPSVTEVAMESKSCSIDSNLNVKEMVSEKNSSLMYGGEALDLTDAYKIAVSNSGKLQSSGVQTEQWTGKDSSKVSEDLKALLTQISASRGIELLSPRAISPKISVNSDDVKNNLDDMHFLLQKRMLERNESNLSLDGVAVCEIEGESETDRLKRQVDHDWKLLTGLYKELEEERSASAVAANQAMAMITRLQEEKASLQMEALQNLRMMEEQAEYDIEAIQKLNDLLTEREKELQDLEAELELYQNQSPSTLTGVNAAVHPERSKISENPGDMEAIQKLNVLLAEREKEIQDLEAELEFYRNQSSAMNAAAAKQESSKISENPVEPEKEDITEKVVEADMPHNNASNLIKKSLLGFEEERFYITDCLENIKKKLHRLSSNGIHADLSNGGYLAEEEEEEAYDPKDVNTDETHKNQSPTYEKSRNMVSVEDEVSELHERLETLKGDLYFLEHIINSLGHGNEGIQFIKEIASHLQTLRNFSIERSDQLKEPH